MYDTRPTQQFEIIPLDARLGLPESDFSYVPQEWDQALCVKTGYTQTLITYGVTVKL